jgi:maltooligosyltrehalose trehalohydrolase
MSAGSTTGKAMRLGANRLADGRWEFLLWAANARTVSLHLLHSGELLTMTPLSRGYFRRTVENLEPGTRYLFQLDGARELPDPASRFQPEGVHGPSEVVDLNQFQWTDQAWQGRTLERSIFYEIHVGTYTAQGTFDALIPHIPELVELGITTVELMPVAQFPGSRNWGYDGVYPFAPQNSYGGPEPLQRFVNAAHEHGLSVALDVVYNHLGPEGNYLNAYGPYFTDRYRTPWGQALNFDGAGSDEVRRFFIENALYWLENYHFDALRLDAVHGIFDFSARHFLTEIKSAVGDLSKRLGRMIHCIAESDLNDSRLLLNHEQGGYDLDAQWSDDFHHSVHRLLTGEDRGYYADFEGIAPLAATLRDGWYYKGQYSHYRQRHHGNSPRGIAASQVVVCTQNHDQVGNRAAGERLSSLVNFESLKLAAGITLLSPFVPLLFMGEEYGETAPFQYFTSHGDPELVEAVRRGRREEFAAFGWEAEKAVPDPQDESTFLRSKPDHSRKSEEPHRTLLRLYQNLIRTRREYDLGDPAPRSVREIGDSALLVLRQAERSQQLMIFNFGKSPMPVNLPDIPGPWRMVMNSADASWNSPGYDLPDQVTLNADGLELSPYSFMVMEQEQARTEAI